MFATKPYVEMKEKRQLARSFNVSEKKIQQWFVDMRKRKDKSHQRLSYEGE